MTPNPLEVHLVAGDIEGLLAAVYRYDPHCHELAPGMAGDRRRALGEAALGQAFTAAAPPSVVIAAVAGPSTRKYGERSVRYVHMEAGHAAQNACLECTALSLGTVAVGAFHDGAVSEVLGLRDGVEPLYLMPVGHPA